MRLLQYKEQHNRPKSHKKIKAGLLSCFYLCDPGEARTLDPLIKSQLLYQLSYGVIINLRLSIPSQKRVQRYGKYLNYARASSKKYHLIGLFPIFP